MLAIDVANEKTDIEDVRSLVSLGVNQDVLEATNEVTMYILGETDELQQSSLEAVANSSYTMSAEEEDPEMIRRSAEQQRESNEEVAARDMLGAYASVLNYVYTGQEKNEAQQAQRQALSNDWDMEVTLDMEMLDFPTAEA